MLRLAIDQIRLKECLDPLIALCCRMIKQDKTGDSWEKTNAIMEPGMQTQKQFHQVVASVSASSVCCWSL